MKKFPLYIQLDAMDCGPTCLKMIAAFYGKSYSIEDLRKTCYISRKGVSLLGISESAEKIGFHTIGLQFSIGQLVDKVPLPCILHWNQKHFVVLYKIKKKGDTRLFYIADPVGKKIVYTEEEFSYCWHSSQIKGESTGALLSIDPTPQFYEDNDETEPENKKATRRSLLFLFSYLRPYKRLIFQLFIGLATGSMLQLILPFLTQSIVDYGISDQNLTYIYLVLIAQLALTFGNTTVDFIRGWILLHLGARVNISLISDYLAKLMRLPIAFFDTKMTGDILQRISDHSRIQSFLTNSSLFTLFSVVNILILGSVILIYNYLIFIIYFIGSGLYIGWVWIFMKKRAALDYKMFSQNAQNQSNIIQLITGMQEIKLNTCEQYKRWEWEHIQAKIFKLMTKGLALAQYQQSGGIFINQIKNLIITAFVATLVVKGEITLGMMLAIQYIIGQLNSPVDQLITFFRQYQDAKLSLDRLKEIYAKEDEEPQNRNLISTIKNSEIQIKNLTFRYEKLSKIPTLSNLNLIIPKGKTTAIVGLSGSGKTTLMKLLLGFYIPDEGEITINNSNLENYDKREWRKCCGSVMQDGFIFSDTISRNIAMRDEKIDKEQLIKAVETANIKDFIESLPLGYNTKIGAEGMGLSQGQKQRILIARAVYKNPDFIFLDEATNSLDANNEKYIMEKLNYFLEGRTAIIIAHRLSTVRHANQIIVLQKGCVEETGTHEELINMHGIYYNLVKNQLDI